MTCIVEWQDENGAFSKEERACVRAFLYGLPPLVLDTGALRALDLRNRELLAVLEAAFWNANRVRVPDRNDQPGMEGPSR